MKRYLIGLNFMDYIEKFSEQYDIKEKFLFVSDVISEEVLE